jgi:DnaJ like chaperone protein
MSFRQIVSRFVSIARANAPSFGEWRGRDAFELDKFDEELRRAEAANARAKAEAAGADRKESRAAEPDVEILTHEIEHAYRTLGVSPSASIEEVTRAYRVLIVRHHPDRQISAGQAARDAATLRAQEINEAYRIVKEHRGNRR